MTYAEKLQDPRWQKKRLEVLQRDHWTCKLCGDAESTLHIHHIKYNNNPWDADLDDLITYCKHCHAIIEYNKKQEKIIPYQVRKYFLDDDSLKLILLYGDENKEDYVDFYKYLPNNKLEYLTSVSAVTIGRINHFFRLINDF